MDKVSIKNQLHLHHQEFVDYMQMLSDDQFMYRNGEKWNASQQLEHIYRSTRILKPALMLPKWLLKLYFGKANRPSKTYEELLEKYKARLAAGGRAGAAFVPGESNTQSRKARADKQMRIIQSITNSLDKYTESQLDLIILPHPLLGKLTLREMMYFCILHVKHHMEKTRANLQ